MVKPDHLNIWHVLDTPNVVQTHPRTQQLTDFKSTKNELIDDLKTIHVDDYLWSWKHTPKMHINLE